ncbi:Gfo/Idh/MocA family protein [Candidatus Sumerlaeota bacterium]
MTIRVGMIGAGQIACSHCEEIAGYKGAELAAVADLSRKRREALAEEFKIPWATAKWEDVVADKTIDAVTIALPNSLHAPVSAAALKAGKHVHLDKPFTVTLREANQVAATAKKSRKVLMVGMNMRYRPESQGLRNAIARGMLGDIYHARTYWYRRAGAPKFGTWFVNKELAGGGCLLDIGVHYLDLSLYLIDNWDPVSVTGRVTGMFGHKGVGEGGWGQSDRKKSIKFDVEDGAHGFIKFRNGMTLELGVSWAQHQSEGNMQGVELYGAKAGASLDASEIYRPKGAKGEYEIRQIPAAPKSKLRSTRIVDWLDAIKGKREPICSVEQALVVQKILDAIYKSSATGREVRFK